MRNLGRALYRGWMRFAHVLGVIQTFLILAIIYFVVMGVMAPLVRLFAGDLLDRRLRDRTTVWSPKAGTNLRLEEAKHLF